MRYILLLGGNIGDVKQTMRDAIQRVCRTANLIDTSAVYTSSAWGFSGNDFQNQIAEVESPLEPEAMLDELQAIERQLGRATKSHNGQYASRTIDIDILFCDQRQVSTPRLTIPHPILHLRRFTLVPLCEKWRYLVHPTLGKTAQQLLSECPDEGTVTKNID